MVRGSLGAVKLLGEEAVSHRYPMYVIKVTDLLELDKWVPHQDLVKAGKMIQVRSDLDVEVLFISHEGVGFTHADPNGDQTREQYIGSKKKITATTILHFIIIKVTIIAMVSR